MKSFLHGFIVALIVMSAFSCTTTYAQIGAGQLDGRVNTVYTAIPFLRINPDTRTGAMGDVGIATEADAASMYHNASKLAFAEQPIGLAVNYTPWLRQLVDDIFIGYLSGYYKINDMQSLGVSMRYFSLGEIRFTNIMGDDTGQFFPNEFAFDVAYARKLSDNFGVGITLKYVRSDLAQGQEVGSGNIVRAAQAVASDISFSYRTRLDNIGYGGSELFLGAAFTNIGNKVSYTEDDTRDFIPLNAGIGAGWKMRFDDFNTLLISADINKLMAPTPDTLDTDPMNGIPDTREAPLLSGMFGSFADAPGGFNEEMRELMFSVGLEYWYNNQFAIRGGYFHEHATKGNRKFITLGIGLRYSVFGLNFSYIAPTSNQQNPLGNTLRFGLTFDFNGEAKEAEEIE